MTIDNIYNKFNTEENSEIQVAKQIFIGLLQLRNYLTILHFNPKNWNNHLIYEKAANSLDSVIDDIGEQYFLAQQIDLTNLVVNNQEQELIEQVLNLIDLGEQLYSKIPFECFRAPFSKMLGTLAQIRGWLTLQIDQTVN